MILEMFQLEKNTYNIFWDKDKFIKSSRIIEKIKWEISKNIPQWLV